MKRLRILWVALFGMFFWVATTMPVHAISPPEKGGTFPDIVLPVPADPADRRYLGLPENGTFKIPDIKAGVVIIEVFNMY